MSDVPTSETSAGTPSEIIVPQNSFPIVGIGASAGGLEAFTDLLKHLPGNTGLAFILVQHLDPNRESHLSELLDKATRLKVLAAEEGTAIAVDHVYVVPPHRNLSIENGRIKLEISTDTATPHSIDFLFRSLAGVQGGLAIGVVLSGTGNDGTFGLEEIKAAGGITFAQDEKSAEFSAMPRQAANVCVDFILPPEKIAEELARIGRDPYLALSLKNGADEKPAIDDDFRRILSVLRLHTGIDLSQYRDATIKRRIQRRMLITTRHTLADYIELLEKDSAEAKSLFEDVLISVTSFFREPEMFELLKQQIFPEILKSSPGIIRVWVPACSTGQEAYSMAIALLEFLEKNASPPAIQIFATDVNESVAIEKARRGLYPESIAAEMSPERLQRYFTKEKNGYRISKAIRDLCIFARQNITADPPFSRVHLISCRNVLIYFTSGLQRQVLSMFHYALNASGYLVLGSSETVGANSDLFDPLDRKHKVFLKKETAVRPFTHLSLGGLKPTTPAVTRANSAHAPGSADFQKEADRILLSRYSPAAVLANSNLEVLQFRGRTSLYLEPPQGEASFNLLKMARENLPLEIGSAIQEVKRQNVAVRRTAHLPDGSLVRRIELEVIPVRLPGSTDVCFLVVFEEPPKEIEAPKVPASKKSAASKSAVRKDPELEQLRRELSAAREYLQTVIEQHDTANEELKCANEEILSRNEELQSTNEQLSTAKEELQSSNEELITLNDELQLRNTELNQLNSDLHQSHERLLDYVNTMVDTVRSPLLVLRADLQVHKANEAFYNAFGLSAAETENRLIFELAVGRWDTPELRQSLAEVAANKGGLRDFEVIWDLPRSGRRVMLFNARRLENARRPEVKSSWPTMFVLSIEDITTLRQIEETNRWLAAIVESSNDAIIGEDFKGKIISCNEGACQLYGYAANELIGESISILFPPELQDEETRVIDRVRRGDKIEQYETVRQRKDGTRLQVSLTVSPIRNVHGQIAGASNTARNITERKQAEAALRESEERFRIAADSAPVLIWLSDQNKTGTWFNKPWLDFTGRTMEQEIGEGWAENVHPNDLSRCLEIYHTAFDARREFKMEYRLRRYDGEYRWIFDHGIPRYLASEFVGYIGSCVDVTDRKITEEKLETSFTREKEARESAEAANRAKDGFLAALSHELRTPLNPVLLLASDATKNPDLSPEIRKDFDTIRKNVELEARLIDDLLDLTRITFGKLTLDLKPDDAHEILKDALAAVKPELDRKHIELAFNLNAPVHLVRCDAVRLQQVFWNVLKNAVKFTPAGGRIAVETSAVATDKKWEVSVTDTGIGMLPDELDRVFSAFSQGHEGHRFGGLGLGLAISRKLVELHAGEIRALSEGRNQGATFIISVPLIARENETASPAAAAGAPDHPDHQGIRILLVEDHEPTRVALVNLLSRRRYHVVAAGLISEALEIAKKETFDLVISDIGLPDGNGNDLMMKLRDNHGLKGIALTGYGTGQDIARSRAAGFVAHLTKPVLMQSLEDALAIPDLWPSQKPQG